LVSNDQIKAMHIKGNSTNELWTVQIIIFQDNLLSVRSLQN